MAVFAGDGGAAMAHIERLQSRAKTVGGYGGSGITN
jgi:hypothetical protein